MNSQHHQAVADPGAAATAVAWAPDGVIERIERHRAQGVSSFIIEFFGRDTTEPARLFAEKVMPAFA